MTTTVATMQAVFGADTSGFDAGLQHVQGGLTGLVGSVGTGLENLGGKITGTALKFAPLTAAAGAFGAVGLRAFTGFEDRMLEIQARTGATAAEMENVRQVALQMGADTSFSATDAAEAILQLMASGYDLDQTFAALPAVLDAATASGGNLGMTADWITDALAMYNMEASEAVTVSDLVARAAGASSAEMDDLFMGLANVGPVADQFNIPLKDSVAVLAAFSERGIKGAEAGTQFKSMLTNMTRDTADVTAMWEKLGISMFDVTGA
ncbi:MAG: phage tail tape measure protein, partial [Planctomycetes bacterium]|nr:phage tail tape measure protein [Planctomycetota bacterium]